jgi:hypothetical protein
MSPRISKITSPVQLACCSIAKQSTNLKSVLLGIPVMIFETISIVAGLLGVSAKDLLKKVENYRKGFGAKQLQQRKLAEATFVTPQTIRGTLNRFYSKVPNELTPYCLTVDGCEIFTTIFTRPGLVNLRLPPQNAAMEHITEFSSCLPTSPALEDYSCRMMAQHEAMGMRLWDSHKYRMTLLIDNPLQCGFADIPFFAFRYSSGLLEDELIDVIIATEGKPERIKDIGAMFPLRSMFLPDLAALLRFDTRICCGGVGVVFALQRENDYLIHLQVRSQEVSDGRGLTALVPKGFHDSAINSKNEVNIHWTIFRELFEEIYGGVEAEKRPVHLSHDYYFDEKPLKWFENNDCYTCDITSLGFNAIAGEYEFGILLAVHDTNYLSEFHRKRRGNWEPERFLEVSSTDTQRISELLRGDNWASDSLFHFAEGLRRLKELDPVRVALPEITFDFERQ